MNRAPQRRAPQSRNDLRADPAGERRLQIAFALIVIAAIAGLAGIFFIFTGSALASAPVIVSTVVTAIFFGAGLFLWTRDV
ncbi:hypothetical protein MHY20_08790 [Helcobacillus sp. ACRRO]|uniref:hypothetical protein n=1 Tax=Helcobacillus sp. ACRRO TaxID=2918202 RepID=UPI001EF4C251|nr:hypothetical protein [Helcobacillus sp. ACRRO]MCG7427700.1 hypothetical protein [Helcobacillus sp. ACRRO]